MQYLIQLGKKHKIVIIVILTLNNRRVYQNIYMKSIQFLTVIFASLKQQILLFWKSIKTFIMSDTLRRKGVLCVKMYCKMGIVFHVKLQKLTHTIARNVVFPFSEQKISCVTYMNHIRGNIFFIQQRSYFPALNVLMRLI